MSNWRGGCVLLCLNRFFHAWEGFTADPLGCQSRTVVLFLWHWILRGRAKKVHTATPFQMTSVYLMCISLWIWRLANLCCPCSLTTLKTNKQPRHTNPPNWGLWGSVCPSLHLSFRRLCRTHKCPEVFLSVIVSCFCTVRTVSLFSSFNSL